MGHGIEIDLQPSADGQAMVFHDATLARMTGAGGPVSDHSAAALSALRLAGSDHTIPTLSAVLAEVACRAPLLIELKPQPDPAGDDRLARATAAALAGHAGPPAVMSFLPGPVAAMARHAPQIPRGLVTWGWDGPGAEDRPAHAPDLDHLRAIADFDALGCAFVSHHHRDLGRPQVAALKARGVPILCWTVRSPTEAAAARRIADQITYEGYTP